MSPRRVLLQGLRIHGAARGEFRKGSARVPGAHRAVSRKVLGLREGSAKVVLSGISPQRIENLMNKPIITSVHNENLTQTPVPNMSFT